MVVGLTGKYCSGKNAAAVILEEMGAFSIDVDKLGHAALEANRGKLAGIFGDQIIGGDGNIDRRRLGRIVFSDPESLARLESVSHPWMVEEVRRRVAEAEIKKISLIVINAAILEKMNLHHLCDAVIWIDSRFVDRMKRGLKRDNLGLRQILRRMWNQRKLSSQSLSKNVDTYRVGNSAGISELRLKLKDVLDEIGKKGSYGK